MGRGKLSMKLIPNEKSRKTTFFKRKKSLMRKAYELSTLCDVRTCVFILGPNQNDQSPVEVHTWPPSRDDVNDMIASYRANCLHKRARKPYDLLEFFSERKKKIEGDISKLRKDLAEARFSKWDTRLDYLLEDQLRVLITELDSKLDAAKRRIEVMIENLEEGMSSAAGSGQVTLNTNMKQKQVMKFEEQNSYGMFGSSLGVETQANHMPFHHQYQNLQIQTMAQSLQMDNELDNNNLSPFLLGSSHGPSATQIQFNYGSFQNPNIYNDPAMGTENSQNYSLCHYGVPLPSHSVLPLSYMQLSDDQVMMACASSNSHQMGLANINASAQLNDHFDYMINYEYFMKSTNNF